VWCTRWILIRGAVGLRVVVASRARQAGVAVSGGPAASVPPGSGIAAAGGFPGGGVLEDQILGDLAPAQRQEVGELVGPGRIRKR
jgi:hypothetical protein